MQGAASSSDLPEELVDEILRILDGSEAGREAAIQALCIREPARAGEIRLLAEAGRVREDTAVPARGQQPAPIQTVGPYRILERIGTGGMGAVYLAEQREPIRRRVALKVIRRDLGVDPRAMLARFEVERAALSRMEHSNIAKVLDAGIHDGQPYFAMEYVKGIPITRYCDENKLTLEDRLRLFLQVCSGVQHAHNKGVIHRDLTPNNVLVTVQDGEAAAKIIDFGLAKGSQGALTDRTVFTQHGAVLGTPAYMSPEQAGLGGLDIDTRSDVYTLGVLLYELLTGGLPFEGKELHAAPDPYRVIREQDPPAPSTRMTTRQGGPEETARLRRTEVRSLLDRLRADLDWIVLKCLEKDRTRRYGTPSALADDIGRHLAHEPVLARAPTFAYRMSKVLRRHATALLAAAGVLASILAGLGVAVAGWSEAASKAREIGLQKVEIEQQKELSEKRQHALAAMLRDLGMLSTVVRFRAVQEEEAGLYPATREREPLIAAWLGRAQESLAMRGDVRTFLTTLQTKRPSDVGRDEWVDRFLNQELNGFLEDLDTFEATTVANVRRDREWISVVEQLSVQGQALARWKEAKTEILRADDKTASRSYADARIHLAPQLGLVPIGMNPATKLWEFLHLRSAADPRVVPVHQPDGRIDVTPGGGIVFVLLPGGRFQMGAQRGAGPNRDANAELSEGPVHEVELGPFLIARHELTQGQWERLWATEPNPSYYENGVEHYGVIPDGSYPVDSIECARIETLLARHELLLPTEAQWEYAARGRSVAPWCCGDDPTALDKVANLADATLDALHRDFKCESWNDGYAVPAPVGRLGANAFGLHDVHGNLAEWVRDPGLGYEHAAAGPDGLRGDPASSEVRILRGAAMTSLAVDARCAARYRETRRGNSAAYGVRVVRRLTTD